MHSYIWIFERKQSPRILEQLDLYGQNIPVLMLKSHLETAQLLAFVAKRH